MRRTFKKGDKIEILSNLPVELKNKPKPILGRVVSVDGYYIYVKPKYQRFEMECYSGELKLIEK